MITSLLIAVAKVTLLALGGWLAVIVLPASWLHLRRRVATAAVWAMAVLPWVTLPVAAPLGVNFQSTGSDGNGVTLGLIVLWAIGFVVMALRLGVEAVCLHRVIKHSRSIGEHAGLPVWSCKGLRSPCLVGWWRPRMLVPQRARRWETMRWRAMLDHEAQHARQCDGLHRPMMALLRAVFWWHPLVRLACRRAEIESELCCDAAASAGMGNRAYGELLLALASRAAGALAPAWTQQPAIKERLTRLLFPQPPSRCAVLLRSGLAIAAIGLMTWLACGLHSSDALREEALLRISAQAFPEP